jgi:hypothetical protein
MCLQALWSLRMEYHARDGRSSLRQRQTCESSDLNQVKPLAIGRKTLIYCSAEPEEFSIK